jgi:hypothetical protein
LCCRWSGWGSRRLDPSPAPFQLTGRSPHFLCLPSPARLQEEELRELVAGRPNADIPALLPTLFLRLDQRLADPASRPELCHLASSSRRYEDGGELLAGGGDGMAVAAGTQHHSHLYGRWARVGAALAAGHARTWGATFYSCRCARLVPDSSPAPPHSATSSIRPHPDHPPRPQVLARGCGRVRRPRGGLHRHRGGGRGARRAARGQRGGQPRRAGAAQRARRAADQRPQGDRPRRGGARAAGGWAAGVAAGRPAGWLAGC